MILNVTEVTYLGDYTLICTFNNGEKEKLTLLLFCNIRPLKN